MGDRLLTVLPMRGGTCGYEWRPKIATTLPLHWWERLFGDFPVIVFLDEGFHGPVVGEEGGEPAVGIAGECGAHGECGADFGGERIAFLWF